MMSDETLVQSEDAVVTRTLLAGVVVSRGSSPTAANTSVSAELGDSRRSNQDTLRCPCGSALRRAGRKWSALPVSLFRPPASPERGQGLTEPATRIGSYRQPHGPDWPASAATVGA